MRPVEAKDVPGILAIYNHWVENSLSVDDSYQRVQSDMSRKINEVFQLTRLPCIVAVLRFKKKKQYANSAMFSEETVVGYALLSGNDNIDIKILMFTLTIIRHRIR